MCDYFLVISKWLPAGVGDRWVIEEVFRDEDAAKARCEREETKSYPQLAYRVVAIDEWCDQYPDGVYREGW